jgi:inward rectifier potassium channel
MAQALRRKERQRSARAFGTEHEEPTIRRINYNAVRSLDIYHRVLTIGWLGFFAIVAVCYVAFNLVFAGLYLLQPGAIANARPGSFADAFFFSVQTMATIGYGQLAPQTLYANLLVAVEVLLGMSGLALATGVIFARFSRPRARVLFSQVAVVTPYDGVPTLMFRAANQRRDQILEAEVTVSLLRDETAREGGTMRRFQDLTLSRNRTPMFGLTWTVMHPIDKTSPLHGVSPQSLAAAHAEIVIVLTGLDAGYAQTIHARHSYVADEILWNRKFVDVLSQLEDGTRVIDYRRFHDVVELGE